MYKEQWVPFTEVDFNDQECKAFHVDTRDFSCIGNTHMPDNLDVRKVEKNPSQYVHSAEEVKQLLTRLHEESGGPGEWRMLSLTGDAAHRTDGWAMKYIRFYRWGDGLLATVGHGDNCFVMSKSALANPVEQRYLNHH